MLENEYIAEIKSTLRKEGFWGQPVRKLVEELQDHFRARAETLTVQGHTVEESRRLASATLGEPKVVAAEWIQTLQSKSWIASHPWLTLVIGLFGTWIYIPFIIFTFAGLGWQGSFSQKAGHFLANDLPWVIGIMFLVWHAVKSPRGWKALFLGALVLGLSTSAWNVYYIPAHDSLGPIVTFRPETWTTVWAYPLAYAFNAFDALGGHPYESLRMSWLSFNLIKLILPFLAVWAARWIITQSGRLTAQRAN